jgi:hypothetical protein
MFLRDIWIIVLFIGLALSCSEDNNKVVSKSETFPTAIKQVLEETEELLLQIKNNLLVIDSTDIESYILSQGLEHITNTYRTELAFRGITFKKIYKCNNGVISTVHYDFYYDSLNTSLEIDAQTVLNLVQSKFGDCDSIHNSGSMVAYSWVSNNNIIDYELFNNGFTFTIRKNQTTEKPIEVLVVLPKHLELTEKLIQYEYSGSLKLGLSIMTDVQNLFKVGFKSKSNTLAFSETYNENVLLSGSFLFEGENLSGVYFDYMYSDTISNEFLTDVKTVKSIITKLYGEPSGVATVPLSTSYRWSNTLIVLEMFGDGFSVLLEKPRL